MKITICKINFTIVLYIVVILIISCSPRINNIPGYTSISTIDFTKYSKIGFLITPYKYAGDYKSIGIIDIVVMPNLNLRENSQKNKNKKQYFILNMQEISNFNIQRLPYWHQDKVDFEKCLDALVSKAKGMDADAIVDFSIQSIEIPYPTVIHEGMRLSGFAIKRLGAFK